ncbi:hypothetical protein, variant [Loa loa]|nr:hypothetical protein LOAG_15696 [Loa loa]XP_020304545.1 hypothetical protein, variant [Loa loa]EFO12836.1 hypothetical protein LOAG_15696 [Loa loa]EJD73587.1 hypothetical protein, variant [Loa loa]
MRYENMSYEIFKEKVINSSKSERVKEVALGIIKLTADGNVSQNMVASKIDEVMDELDQTEWNEFVEVLMMLGEQMIVEVLENDNDGIGKENDTEKDNDKILIVN